MYDPVPADYVCVPVSAVERQQVLAALERLQTKLAQKEEWGHSQTLGALRDTLHHPLLAHILTLQHSVRQLRDQLNNLPGNTCNDFSFSRKGQLIVSLAPPTTSSLQAPPPQSSALAPPPQASVLANGSASLSPEQLQRWIQSISKDQVVEVVSLSRPAAGGLGFSVAALRSEGTQRGFFIKHIQPGGVAQRDGRLKEMDRILVMNGSPLDPELSQQGALILLQQPAPTLELLVARDRPPHASPLQATPTWEYVEEVELVNDGSGLGFGIVGGRTSGVVVRTLVPNSVADKDGRLRTGDHILRIGATPTGGLTSDQVVRVLQGCGSRVTMLIAREARSQSPAPTQPPPPPSSAPIYTPPPPPACPPNMPLCRVSKTFNLEGYEVHDVCLSRKEGQSLGISIIGYNALTSQDAVGVFVKHVVPGSAADQSGNIRVHDRLIALDGVSLQGFTNQEVLEVMKEARQEVQLSLVRKTRTLERSLDRVERESSRVSLKRSLEVRTRSSDLNRTSVTTVASCPAPKPSHTKRTPGDEELLSEQDVKSKWEQALGPQYHVMIVELDPVIEDDAELQKYSKLLPIHTMRLGVELDSFDGHHYVSSLAPGGALDTHGLIHPEDELLEVNGVQLYGKSRREAVAFLREVPPPFTLVCCRHLDLENHQEPEQWRTTPNVEESLTRPMIARQTEMPHEASCRDLSEPGSGNPPAPPHSSRLEKEEAEEEGELALWSPDIQMLELQKESDQGLGFSILDYQDPVDPGSCVMVVRSLVASGAAERQGCLLPGDQLVSVNQTLLEQLSLAQAVEVLKSAPPGPVRLGIRKPLTPSERQTDIRSLDRLSVSLTHTLSVPKVTHTLPVSKGFGDGSILPEDLREAAQEEEELVLDGGLPRYSSLVTSDLLVREELEMTVDDYTKEISVKILSAEYQNISGSHYVSLTEQQSVDSEADSELTLTDTDTESVSTQAPLLHRPLHLYRGHSPKREDGEGEETPAFSHWGPPRRVEVWLEPGQSLGISIVGGHHVIKRLRNGEELRGIFIKQVLPNSPAAQTNRLKTGDKILEV
ncbi:unnamed protein product [Merluccius merluccius]